MKNRINEIEELMGKILKEKSAPMLKKLLDKSVIFRNFSPRNSILITMQCPEATTVMGRKAWERYGMKPRNDYIVITGIKREIRGDEEKKEQWLKRNPFRQITDGILPERLRSLQKGNKPTKEELEFASSIIPDFDKMYDNWIKSKPKEVRFTNLYIPVKVYDISQCEIVDEEKFKNLPRPKMDIEYPEALPIKKILEEQGFAIDGSAPVSIGKAVGKVVLIDGQANEQEKTFQLAQAWASTKVKEPHEAVMAATMLMLHTGMADVVPDSVLEVIFLKVKTPKELSAAISKAGKAFREMAEELEVAIEQEIKTEKEKVAEEMDEIDLELF